MTTPPTPPTPSNDPPKKKKATPAGKPPITQMTDALKQPPLWSKEARSAMLGEKKKGQVGGGSTPGTFQRKGLSGSAG